MSETSCTCDYCKKACELNPGWFLPEEARLAMYSGYAKRMMLDWYDGWRDYIGDDNKIYVLAPASKGYESKLAPNKDDDGSESFMVSFFMPWNKGRCTLLSPERLCTIHDSGFKPFQCRSSFSCKEYDTNSDYGNEAVANQWDTKLGRKVIKEWKRLVKFTDY